MNDTNNPGYSSPMTGNMTNVALPAYVIAGEWHDPEPPGVFGPRLHPYCGMNAWNEVVDGKRRIYPSKEDADADLRGERITNANTAYPTTRYEAGIGLCQQPSITRSAPRGGYPELLTLPHGSTLDDLLRAQAAADLSHVTHAQAEIILNRLKQIAAQRIVLEREDEYLRKVLAAQEPVVQTTAKALPARALAVGAMRVGLRTEVAGE